MTAHERLGRPFGFLWAATGLSNLADGVLLVGAPLLAVTMTRSPVLVSLVSAAATAPWLLCTLYAGALADRQDRRRIMLAAAWARSAVLVLAALAASLHALPLPLLYVTVLLVGTAEVFTDTSAQSVLPMTVPASRLSAANGRIVSAQTVTNSFLGGPLAGVLVALAAGAVFAVPAVAYLLAGLLLLGMTGRYRARVRPPESMRADIAAGLRHLRGHRVLRSLAAFAATLNLANGGYYAVLVLWVVGPQSAVGLTAAGYGLLSTALAAGALVGSFGASWLARRLGEIRTMYVAVLVCTLPLVVPVLVPRVIAVAGALAVMGAGGATLNVLVVTLRQRLVPAELFGRVNAGYRLLAAGAAPLGAALGGVLAALAGVPAVAWTAMALCLGATVLVRRAVSSRTVAAAELARAEGAVADGGALADGDAAAGEGAIADDGGRERRPVDVVRG